MHKVDDMAESLGQTSKMSEDEEALRPVSAIDPQDDNAKEDSIVSDFISTPERPVAAFGRQDDSWVRDKKKRPRKSDQERNWGEIETFN